MAKKILLIGGPASGKTYSLRNLPPDETYWFRLDGTKELTFPGGVKNFHTQEKNGKKPNMINTRDLKFIRQRIQELVKLAKHKKYIVVDTLNSAMDDKEMELATTVHKGSESFKVWTDFAQSFKMLIANIDLDEERDDLTIIFVAHADDYIDETGKRRIRMKTNGRKIESFDPEGLFSTVLLCEHKEEDEYKYIANQYGTPSRSPAGILGKELEPDIMKVIEKLNQYYND